MEYRLRTFCSPSVELQQWLQLTYEIETRYFERQRLAADSQLKAAKDMVSHHGTCYKRLEAAKYMVSHYGTCYKRLEAAKDMVSHHGTCYKRLYEFVILE